jgi:alkylhydroperoxidase/carboxymuconolactone decarboxylase family protein YurZ
MGVLDERRAKGIQDQPGKEATKVEGTNKYKQGRKTLEELTGTPQSGPLTGPNAFATGIDTFLKEHLFADIFGRGVLTYQQRELATITVLATLPVLGSQLQSHIGMGMHIGLTEELLRDDFLILENKIGNTQADAANAVLNKMVSTK